MKDLPKVKRDPAWKAVDPAAAWHPSVDMSGFAGLREPVKVKRDTSWKAAELAWSR